MHSLKPERERQTDRQSREGLADHLDWCAVGAEKLPGAAGAGRPREEGEVAGKPCQVNLAPFLGGTMVSSSPRGYFEKWPSRYA